MSSDDETTDASSSPPPETLIAGRAKRVTAGNRLSHLLQHLDDEDVKADLLAEEEDDQKDYSASEDGDGDIAFESSDESDEEGKVGVDDELAGEKELQKQERVESKRKRKARELVRVQPMKKRVKIADDAMPVDAGPAVPTISRKMERASLGDLGPKRQSSRTQTVASAKITEAKVKESRRRAERTQEVMRLAAEKKAAEAGPKLTQADRMARALKIEKENAKSLNRWEKSEQERIRLQQEKLEAMRNRKLDGPIIRYWSGPVTWFWRQGPEGPLYARCKYHIEEVEDDERQVQEKPAKPVDQKSTDDVSEASRPSEQHQQDREQQRQCPGIETQKEEQKGQEERKASVAAPADAKDQNFPSVDGNVTMDDAGGGILVNEDTSGSKPAVPTQPQANNQDDGSMFLDGIQLYASDENQTQPTTPAPSAIDPDTLMDTYNSASTTNLGYYPSMPPYIHNHYTTHITHPLLSEKASRILLVLSQFPDLDDSPPTSRRTSTINPSQVEPISRILLPNITPTFTPEEKRYFTTRPRKTKDTTASILPAPPARPTCIISGKTARFRDPKTGMTYADLSCSKAIQRVLANGCQWSSLLGTWAGIVGEGSLGRVARGVPDGFWTGEVKKKEVIEIS